MIPCYNIYKESKWLNDPDEPIFTWYKEPNELFDSCILKIIHELKPDEKLVIKLEGKQE
jgi:hypothetical protein